MDVSFMSNAKQIDQLLEGFLKRGLPGCGLKVVQYGNTLYEGYFGVTDIDTKTPVTGKSVNPVRARITGKRCFGHGR